MWKLALPTGPEIRLVNGDESSSMYSGRVEVRQPNGRWGTICDDWFDNREASVICRMFNFSHALAVPLAQFGQGAGTIHMTDLHCLGTETSIFDCPYNGWGKVEGCSKTEDAGVICSSKRGKRALPSHSRIR